MNNVVISSDAFRKAAFEGPKSWPSTVHDHWLLPSGTLVGAASNEDLRKQLIRLGIDGAATAGRDVLCARYATVLQGVFDAAGNAAVSQWLTERR